MNRCIMTGGEVKNILEHKMYSCSEEYCGDYLDRRYLQYRGGNCECGVIIMNKLGIEPAYDELNEWRWRLYNLKVASAKVREVKVILTSTFESMKIVKPYMVVWYVIAMGPNYIKDLMAMEKKQREGTMWNIVNGINSEYGVHQPVQ